MASVMFDKSGRAMVRFMGPDRKRRTIRLGKISERNADRFTEKVEQLVGAVKHGTQPDDDVIAWTKKLGDDVAAKLADYGLLKRHTNLYMHELFGVSGFLHIY